jgi:hypothetical protein
MTREKKQELIDAFGPETVETALTIVSLVGELDGAWAMAMDEGLDEVADVIEELMMEDDDV